MLCDDSLLRVIPYRFLATLAMFGVAAVAGIVRGEPPAEGPTRESLLEMLRQSFANESGFIRIHAAEALVEQGQGAEVAAVLAKEAVDPPPMVRIGIWRVLAQTSSGAARDEFIAKLRRVMLTPGESDRIQATESLAKLDCSLPDDREAIERLARESTPAHSCHCLWLLALSGDATAESRLADKLEGNDEIARLASSYILGRLPKVSPDSVRRLIAAADKEPPSSAALGYMLGAALLRVGDPTTADRIKAKLVERLTTGGASEKYAAALALGAVGQHADLKFLEPLLREPGDPRIGAAQGSLRILHRSRP